MPLRTCVTPDGRFVFGLHQPAYTVRNLREQDHRAPLGILPDGAVLDNARNFPANDLTVPQTDWVYEIANPFAFRGTTYISKSWAEARAVEPTAIRLPRPEPVSLAHLAGEDRQTFLRRLPQPLLITLATTSTDPQECAQLAEMSCMLTHDANGGPDGLHYEEGKQGPRPVIANHDLFETVANNPALPEAYKRVMVLRPGAQGGSEIVGEYGGPGQETHVFEYLRRNSYIPGGHYAANLADDAVRYSIKDLSLADMTGLRHLYYQRTYVRLAEMVGINVNASRRELAVAELEELRQRIAVVLAQAAAAGTSASTLPAAATGSTPRTSRSTSSTPWCRCRWGAGMTASPRPQRCRPFRAAIRLPTTVPVSAKRPARASSPAISPPSAPTSAWTAVRPKRAWSSTRTSRCSSLCPRPRCRSGRCRS